MFLCKRLHYLVPDLLLVPVSIGTPTKQASKPLLDEATGSLIILDIPLKKQ